ncbi:MAG: tryptophan 2,3-dioxygenase family protein, partial [Gemmatimonadales bacterium]
ISTLQRIRAVLKTLVGQLDVLETMTPMSFSSFRDRLDTASGFQSVQFREIEFLFGYKRPQVLRHIPEGSEARAVLETRLAEPSLMDGLYRLLQDRGIRVPSDLIERDVRQTVEPNEALQDELYRVYQEHPDLVILFELMLDCDEGIQEWRYRHVKLVERTIGAKHGTGGSAGVEFLKQSLFKPLFPDLWALRHRM